MNKNKKNKILLAIGGIVAFIILPRDPWPFGMFIYLFFCSFVGSVACYFLISNYYKSLIVSIIIGACLFCVGPFIIDIRLEPDKHELIAEYIMWLPLMLINCISYVGTVTLFVLPLVEFGFKFRKEK